MAAACPENSLSPCARRRSRNSGVTIADVAPVSRSIGSTSDGGAHGKMFCGAGDNVLLLTEYVRDRGVVTIEQAIHVQTGKIAQFFGLHERGVIEEGKMADIAVFNLAEIERSVGVRRNGWLGRESARCRVRGQRDRRAYRLGIEVDRARDFAMTTGVRQQPAKFGAA